MYFDVYDMVILEMNVIYPLRRFYEIFSMHVLRTREDVTSISWIFVLSACFIALIEVGRYCWNKGVSQVIY